MNQTITFRFFKQLVHQATSTHLPVEHLEITRSVTDYLTKDQAAQLMADVKREANERLGPCNYAGYSVSRA